MPCVREGWPEGDRWSDEMKFVIDLHFSFVIAAVIYECLFCLGYSVSNEVPFIVQKPLITIIIYVDKKISVSILTQQSIDEA